MHHVYLSIRLVLSLTRLLVKTDFREEKKRGREVTLLEHYTVPHRYEKVPFKTFKYVFRQI